MGKIILLFIIFNHNGYLKADFLSEKSFEKNYIDAYHKKLSKQKKINFDYLLSDPLNIISEEFKVPQYFLYSSKFWFNIYTRYGSESLVFHHRDDLSLIYEVISFQELKDSSLNPFTKEALQKQLAKRNLKRIRNILKDPKRNKIFDKAIKDSGLTIPKSVNEKKKFYRGLAKDLRYQTGQKDYIQNGLQNFAFYNRSIQSYFTLFDLPNELLAIPFIESSFRYDAESKVGAKGAWQFMNTTARSFLPFWNGIDPRRNPLLASIGALNLLKENKKLLKRWDLAIPAYNSGTKHLLKAKRSLKKDASLSDILQSYKHPHLGFASKNFYSEFLALVYALGYKDSHYSIPYKGNGLQTNIYISLCPMKPNTLFKALQKDKEIMRKLNLHYSRKSLENNYPPGLIFFSHIPLTNKRYLKINSETIVNMIPKKWKSLLKNQKCILEN